MREGDTAIMNLKGERIDTSGRSLLTRRPARPPEIAIVLSMQICPRLLVKDSSFIYLFFKSISIRKKIEDLYDDLPRTKNCSFKSLCLFFVLYLGSTRSLMVNLFTKTRWYDTSTRALRLVILQNAHLGTHDMQRAIPD